jgi:hypothetical protein
MAAGAAMHLLRSAWRHAGCAGALDLVAPFSSTFCRDAQLTLAGMTFQQLGKGKTRSTFNNVNDFVYSKSTVNNTYPRVMVEVTGYSAQEANADNIHLPPIIDLDYGCKVREPGDAGRDLRAGAGRAAASCRELNQQTMNQALAAVDDTTFMDFLLSGKSLNFLADQCWWQARAGCGPGAGTENHRR